MEIREIKDLLNIIHDEIPNVVKPFFFLCVYIIIFLIVGNNLGLNNSFWLVTKEKVFNLSFYLGIFICVFMALNKAPQEIRKIAFAKKYPQNKLNKNYFLGKYNDRDEVYVFELIGEKRKLWIANLQTKRNLWGNIDPINISEDVNMNGSEIDLSQHPEKRRYDEKIDIVNPERKDTIILATSSLAFILTVLLFLNLPEIRKLIFNSNCSSR